MVAIWPRSSCAVTTNVLASISAERRRASACDGLELVDGGGDAIRILEMVRCRRNDLSEAVQRGVRNAKGRENDEQAHVAWWKKKLIEMEGIGFSTDFLARVSIRTRGQSHACLTPWLEHSCSFTQWPVKLTTLLISESTCTAVAKRRAGNEPLPQSMTSLEMSGADDATWIITSGFIILTMQSGFGLLETGFVSPSHEVNVMMKNVVDVVAGA